MDKYRVYCETHGWQELISSSEPTLCPVDSGNTLRAGSQVIIEPGVTENIDGIPTNVSLSDYKSLKINAIDRRTDELVELGFEFPAASGNIFSLSPSAQTDILALDTTRDDPSVSYPINYNTIDDKDVYAVLDSATMHNMYLAAFNTKKGHLDSGTVLKDLVRAAVDESGVDAVVDNR